MPTWKLEKTAGIPRSVGPARKTAFTRPATPWLNMITPTAPAASALATLVEMPQVPRWTSEIAPLVAAGKSVISQPLVLVYGSVATMSFVGTTGALGTASVGEYWNAM